MNATGRYRYENFETGDANKFSFVLAKMVAENLGSYNPLVIWGNSGLGKTHLLYAIYNYVPAHDINRSEIAQGIENSLIVDIAAVKNGITVREHVKHARSEKTVGIGNYPYFQYTLP